jgi:hypothetical protein
VVGRPAGCFDLKANTVVALPGGRAIFFRPTQREKAEVSGPNCGVVHEVNFVA